MMNIEQDSLGALAKAAGECRREFEAAVLKIYPTARTLTTQDGRYIGHIDLLWQVWQTAWNKRASILHSGIPDGCKESYSSA